MFNIIAPTGWSIGAVRAEDMAVGCGIDVAGLLLWPQGAGAALSRELSAVLRRHPATWPRPSRSP